jgi:hypothetical protein
MGEGVQSLRTVGDLPLSATGCERARQLATEYENALVSAAKVIAFRTGAERVSSGHVDRAFHEATSPPRSRGIEAAKVLGGAVFGVGGTLFAVALELTPTNVGLAALAALGGAMGLASMVWGVSRR